MPSWEKKRALLQAGATFKRLYTFPPREEGLSSKSHCNLTATANLSKEHANKILPIVPKKGISKNTATDPFYPSPTELAEIQRAATTHVPYKGWLLSPPTNSANASPILWPTTLTPPTRMSNFANYTQNLNLLDPLPLTESMSFGSMEPLDLESPRWQIDSPIRQASDPFPSNGGKDTMQIERSSSMTTEKTSVNSTNCSNLSTSILYELKRKEAPANATRTLSSLQHPADHKRPGVIGQKRTLDNYFDVSTPSSSSSLDLYSDPSSSTESMCSYTRGPYLTKKMCGSGWKKLNLTNEDYIIHERKGKVKTITVNCGYLFYKER